MCWPYRPQEKGAVENLVGWVKGSFFKQRRFLDRADLEQQLREWLTEINTVRPSRATGGPPAERIAEERARLRPLKIAPATKYGPKMVECHMGTGAIEKSKETMVWTETATGRMAIAMICIADSSRCHCFGVPCHPNASAP